MAHEISIVNGIAEAMYANQPAWHNLGQVFDLGGETGPDGETARRLAHLDWTVEKEPVYNGDGSRVPGWWTTRRQDNGFNLGMVQDRYVCHQNHEAFDFVDSLVQDGIMRYEAAFALHDGAETVLLARFPEVDTIAPGDHSLRYIAWMNSHDGSSPVVGMPTSVRVVCANTKRLALSRDGAVAMKIRHTASMGQKLVLAQKYLSQFNQGFTLFRDQAQLLATRQVTGSGIEDYLNALFPVEKDAAQRAETMRTNRVNSVRKALLGKCRREANAIPAIAGTWWQLFNAVTYAVDHDEVTYFKGDENSRERAENKFISLTKGTGSEIKDEAFRIACEMASVSTVDLNSAA